jgi:hypothetical protein
MPGAVNPHTDPKYKVKTFLGYSDFPKEILPVPKEWIAETGNLVLFSQHEKVIHPYLFVYNIYLCPILSRVVTLPLLSSQKPF